MKEKLSLITELIKLAKADNEFKTEEYNFILSVCKQIGVSKEQLDELFEKYIEFTPPKLESDRLMQFYRLVLLMNVDKEIKEEELYFVKDLGIKMGLSPFVTNTILKEMYKHKNKMIPPDILIGIYKQNMN